MDVLKLDVYSASRRVMEGETVAELSLGVGLGLSGGRNVS